MTLQHTSKFILFFLLIFVSYQTMAEVCYLDDGKKHSDCERLKISDKRLNTEYKKLVSVLDKDQIAVFKSSQRKWISWRDGQCNQSVEKSSCTNSSCEAVNFNNCMSELTDHRIKEFDGFLEDMSGAIHRKFEFKNQ
jgi:uncharacterized protein YecT (DUF1311 family)